MHLRGNQKECAKKNKPDWICEAVAKQVEALKDGERADHWFHPGCQCVITANWTDGKTRRANGKGGQWQAEVDSGSMFDRLRGLDDDEVLGFVTDIGLTNTGADLLKYADVASDQIRYGVITDSGVTVLGADKDFTNLIADSVEDALRINGGLGKPDYILAVPSILMKDGSRPGGLTVPLVRKTSADILSARVADMPNAIMLSRAEWDKVATVRLQTTASAAARDPRLSLWHEMGHVWCNQNSGLTIAQMASGLRDGDSSVLPENLTIAKMDIGRDLMSVAEFGSPYATGAPHEAIAEAMAIKMAGGVGTWVNRVIALIPELFNGKGWG